LASRHVPSESVRLTKGKKQVMTPKVERETQAFTSYDGTRLAYHVAGDGPLLLCMPGGPGRASTYLEDLAGLASHRRLVLLDLPGTGDSGRPASETSYGFPALARHLDALRAELGLETFALLGHSAGSLVAEIYAATDATRLEALVLVTPAGWLHGAARDDLHAIKKRRSDEPWYEHSMHILDQVEDTVPPREKTLAFRPFMYGAWGERQQAHAASADIEQDESAEAHYWQPGDLDLQEVRRVLGQVWVPTLVIAGDVDAVTGVTAAEAVAAGMAGARLVVLPHCGHFPWVDRPDEFRRSVEGFLDLVGQ
jgi:proline iminopeptidase